MKKILTFFMLLFTFCFADEFDMLQADFLGSMTVSDTLTVNNMFRIYPVRGSGQYYNVVCIADTGASTTFTTLTPAKTYMFLAEVRRVADSLMTGDSRDVLFKGIYRNYAANDASSQMQGIGISVRNESGGTMASMKAGEFGANTKSGATTTSVIGIEATVEHYSAGATTNLFGAKFDIRNESVEATNEYGVVITNTNNSLGGASDAALYITDAGTNTGWDYGIDMSSATVGIAEIIGQNDETIDNVTNGSWDINDADLIGINKSDADSSLLGVLAENVDGNQVNLTDMNKVLSDTTGIGVFYANVDGNQKNITDLNKVVSDTLNDGTATLTAGALSGITTIGMNNQLTNTLADGTTPMVITSTTKVGNLNVDRVDGVHLASLTDTRLMRYESTGTQIENATVTETSGALGGITTIGMSGQLTNSLAIGTSPFAVTSTTVNTNLNADLLDAKSEAAFATLAEAETVSGKYTFSDTLIASKAVKGADGVLLTNESATKATLPSNTSWLYPYDDGASVHLMATKDDAGTETVVKIAEQSSITNLSAVGAFYFGDGTDDYITIADNANLRFGTGNFGLIFKNLRLSDYTPSAAVTIARKANAGAENLGWIFTLETDGKPQIAFGNATNFTTLVYKSATAINATDGTTLHLAAIITRETASVAGSVKFYQFGYDTWKLLSSVAITAGTPQTVTETTPSALVLFQNIDGATEYAFQSFGGFIPCNFAPTYAEVKEFIEKGISYKYQWGSQTELVTDGDMSNAGSWTTTGPGWDINSTVAGKAYYDDSDNGSYFGQSLIIKAGKKYRVTFTLSALTPTGDFNFVNESSALLFANTDIPTGGTLDGTKWTFDTNNTYTTEAVALINATNLRIMGWTSGGTYEMDDLSLTQIGAVLAMRPENMTASTAYDASSNKLNGTVSGATLLNAKVADAFVNPEIATSDDDVIATVKHSGYDSAGNLDDFVKFETIMQDVTATTEDGGYKFSAMVAGTMTNTLEFDGNTGILNIPAILNAKVYNYYADTSSVNDSWGFTASSISAYTTGMSIFVNIGVANTDGATLQINALGAKAVLKMHDTALATNNVEVGQIIHLIYDGTQFQMLSQVAN